MSGKRIAAVILAAGPSSRMGKPKQLLTYNGRPLLVHAAETALASICRPVFVVLGCGADVLRPYLGDLPIQVIDNSNWQNGMGSSISAAARHLKQVEQPIDAMLLLLVDQPLITPDLLNRMADAYAAGHGLLIATRYNSEFGPPVLFDRQYLDELADLDGPAGAKSIIKKHRDHVLFIPFSDAQVDIDTPGDYELLR